MGDLPLFLQSSFVHSLHGLHTPIHTCLDYFGPIFIAHVTIWMCLMQTATRVSNSNTHYLEQLVPEFNLSPALIGTHKMQLCPYPHLTLSLFNTCTPTATLSK